MKILGFGCEFSCCDLFFAPWLEEDKGWSISTEIRTAAAAAKSLQLCLTLCDAIDGSPPGSPIPGILQARVLEWVAISFSNAWKWKVKVKSLSRVRLFVTPWIAAHQAPPSMGLSRQGYWSGLPSPSPDDWGSRPQIQWPFFIENWWGLWGLDLGPSSLFIKCLLH